MGFWVFKIYDIIDSKMTGQTPANEPRNNLSCGEVGVLFIRGERYIRLGARFGDNKLLIAYGRALLKFANWQPIAIELFTQDLIRREHNYRVK